MPKVKVLHGGCRLLALDYAGRKPLGYGFGCVHPRLVFHQLRDVVAFIGEKGAAALDGTVAEAMTTEVISVTPDATVEEVEAIFTSKRFHHLPVEEDGVVAGVVTPPDVLERHLEYIQYTNLLMKDYCSGVYY